MKMLDLFSGIGGFHLGLEQAGFKFDWVGFSEIDKYANKQYKRRFPDAIKLGSITDVQCEDLPKNIDILCGGFPCQAFSIAGLRKGFEDTRGTLFFEIARILRHYKDSGNPIPNFILENVKGLLSHDDGRTFTTIYRVLADLDYTVECQLLNTRWWLPQNRERIYIVGHFRGEPRPKIFPFGESNQISSKSRREEREGGSQICSTITSDYRKGVHAMGETYVGDGLNQIGTIGKDSEATRVYDPSGIARTIKNGGGMGAKTGLYAIHDELYKGRKSRKYTDTAPTLRGNSGQLKVKHEVKGCSNQSSANYINIIGNLKGEDGHECHNVHDPKGIAPTVRHNNGKTTMIQQSNIRRLTPTECERLQGFPDGWTSEQSDTQRYKQLGNAVSVPVVKAVGERLLKYVNIQ